MGHTELDTRTYCDFADRDYACPVPAEWEILWVTANEWETHAYLCDEHAFRIRNAFERYGLDPRTMFDGQDRGKPRALWVTSLEDLRW